MRAWPEFAVVNIPLGLYDFQVVPTFYRDTPELIVRGMPLREGEHIEGIRLVFDRPDTGEIRGTVVDASGDPVWIAEISFPDWEYSSATPYTSQDGYFVVQNVPVGSWTLQVEREGFATTVVRDVVTGSAELRIVMGDR